jgi:hypothetical protein
MRSSDCDILIVTGLGDSGPDHWQTRWEHQLSTARRVPQASFDAPVRDAWVASLAAEVAGATRPVMLVAHSLGVPLVAHAAPALAPGRVAGAFLVAPPDLDDPARCPPGIDPAFAPLPRDPLPFPSVLVASRTDPYCAFERAGDIANAWGSAFVDAGDAGHINMESGHGPWPEGLMRFAGFLRQL